MLDCAIDTHCHFLPPVYADALAAAGSSAVDGDVPVPRWTPDAAIRLMDEIGVCQSILSISSPFLGFVEPGDEAPLAAAINDYAAALIRTRPSRFGSFAVLPLRDLDAAIAEALRALEELGLDGIVLPTNIYGLYPGDAQFAPLWQTLAARGTVVFLHPTMPCCFESIGLGLPAPMIEFPFDSMRAVASLLYSGNLDRYRDRIRWIVPHLGGPLPVLAPRLIRIGAGPLLGDRAIGRDAANAALDRLYYDLGGLSDRRQLDALRAFVPASQILFGSDFPFTPAARVRDIVTLFEGLNLSDRDRAAIERGNAVRLLGRGLRETVVHGGRELS